jgi:hypothetical protein
VVTDGLLAALLPIRRYFYRKSSLFAARFRKVR